MSDVISPRSLLDFSGVVVLVTGAGAGIGVLNPEHRVLLRALVRAV